MSVAIKALLPALIAGLPLSSAWVKIPLPLSCNSPSLASPSIRLLLLLLMLPKILGFAPIFPATIVFLRLREARPPEGFVLLIPPAAPL